MPSPSEPPLKPNPFTTYRDPATGRWIVGTVANPNPESKEFLSSAWETDWDTKAIAS